MATDKLPWFKFHPADWLSEHKLFGCNVATRGIWLELICVMHMECNATVTGTLSELSRLARCEPEEMRDFLTSATNTGFALVTQGNEVYSVTSKRVAEDRKELDVVREQTRERVRRFREKKSGNAVKRRRNAIGNGSVTPASISISTSNSQSSSDQENKEEGPLTPENLMEGWNEIVAPAGLPKVVELTPKRKQLANARIKEHPTKDYWEQAFSNITTSRLLRGMVKGNGHDNWRASFDWVIENAERPVKIYEGNYA